MNLKKQDKTTLSAFKVFRYVLDRIYNPQIQNELIRLGGGYPAPGLLKPINKFNKKLTHYYSHQGWKERPGYDSEGGNILVRESIAKYENRKYSTEYKQENVALVAGATYGTNRILEVLFKNIKNKELLVIAPTFYKGLHRSLELSRVRSVVIRSYKNFVPSAQDILGKISKNTFAVFICNPGNPSGKYIPLQDLKKIIKELRHRNIFLIIDEVQDSFYFTPQPYRYGSWIQSPNVIRIRSVSKELVLAEYRIGYVVADKKIIGNNHRGLIELVGYDIGNPPPVLNYFFKKFSGIEISEWRQKIMRQKNLTIKMLKRIRAIKKIIEPDACFNLVFNFQHSRYKTDIKLFDALIDRKVAMMPVSGFGYDSRACWMRLTFASPDSIIRKGINVLKEILAEK